MALQVDMKETQVGLPCPEAYARVIGVVYDRVKGTTEVAVRVFANAKAKAEDKAPVSAGLFVSNPEQGSPDMESSGVLRACYEWLKTLPAFAGAKDV